MSKVLLVATGFLLAVVGLVGSLTLYFTTGLAPAAVADPPMPFEKKIAQISLRSHTSKFASMQSPVPADEASFLAGAQVYKKHCAACHGVPGQDPPDYSEGMYPPAPLLLKRNLGNFGISYWKVVNGIRLTGMPAFKKTLSETELSQVTQLLTHATQIPESVKKALMVTASDPAPPQETAQKSVGK